MPRDYTTSKKILWRLEYAGYRVMETVLHHLPLPLVDRMGSGVGSLLYLLSSRYRRLATRNLRLAFGAEKSRREIRSLAHHTCQRTVANFLATLKTTTLETSKVRDHVSLLGVEDLQRSLASGQGALLVLGHMGNWEILNRLHDDLPDHTPAGGIYQALTNPLVNRILLRRRQQDGSKLFNKRGGFHGPTHFVKEGGLLIVVVDQRAERVGVPISFFGRLTPLSTLPALMARKTKVPVFAAGIATTRPGHWQVRIESIGTSPDTQTIIHRLESLIRESPADYLWLHDRWKLNRRHPLSIYTRKKAPEQGPTQAVRLLIMTDDEGALPPVTDFLAQRPERDLPLSAEWLFIHATDPPTTRHPTLIAPTASEVAAKVRLLDNAQSAPLELVIVLAPSPEIYAASKLLKGLRFAINRKNLPAVDFLTTLADPALAEPEALKAP